MNNQFLEEHLGGDWIDYFNVEDYSDLLFSKHEYLLEYLYE